MKKVKMIMTALIFVAGMTIFNAASVKAEITYDLNGSKVEVENAYRVTYTDGSYKVVSSQSGTIAYFDSHGNLLKLLNKETEEIIINNEKEEETTTVKEEEITAPKAVPTKKYFTKKKVKKLVSQKVKGTYKSWYSKGKLKKFKYTKGYKLSWKKVKGAKGYEVKVYRYSPVRKKYVVVKTKNTKKKSYFLTDLKKRETYKVTIQAYRGKGKSKKYSGCSKRFKIKSKGDYKVIKTDKHHNIIYKSGFDRFESEKAFVIQNRYRREAGVPELVWSDELYNLGNKRIQDILKNGFSHKNLHSNATEYVLEKSKQNNLDIDTLNKAEYWKYWWLGENLAIGSKDAKDVMNLWKNSKGHYANIVLKYNISGAIALYYNSETGNNYWVSLFADIDYDKEIKSIK